MGQRVTLPCEATGVPEPEYEWTKNGVPMDKHAFNMKWHKGSVTFDSAINIDGVYQCYAKSQYGTAMSIPAKLEQMEIARNKEIGEPRNYLIPEGDSLKLTCDPLPSTPAATFFWSTVPRDDWESAGDLVQITDRIQIDDQGNLFISDVKPADHMNDALYKCNTYNPAMLTTVGGSLSTITVMPGEAQSRSPTLVYSTQPTHVALLGRSTQMKCIFEGK